LRRPERRRYSVRREAALAVKTQDPGGEPMIEIERDEDRVVFHRGFLDDPRLSLRAKGLLGVLLSRGGTVDPSAIGASRERPSEIEAALRELESAGYFTRAEATRGETSLSGTLRETSALPLLDSLPRKVGVETGGARAASARDEETHAAADRILARLNELRKASWSWARYTPLSARHAKNVEHIKGRLREGYAEADLVLVLEYLAAADGGKDESRKYFDSVTPFNTKNFERNLAMARDWEARGRPQRPASLTLDRPPEHDPAIYERWAERGGKT
jgi:uncharacterized phage protein (TIGR02220 family)